MGVLLGLIVKTALQVFAGVGLARFADRWLKPKVPATMYPEEVSAGFGVFKTVALVIFIVLAIMLTGFLGKMLKISFLRKISK